MNTVIERTGFDPAQDADNGNRFLTGNGYMGVRGTIGEAGVQQMTAVNLAGIHHQKGQGWEEPLNAPNPLYVAVKGVSLPENADRLHRTASRSILPTVCSPAKARSRRMRAKSPSGRNGSARWSGCICSHSA